MARAWAVVVLMTGLVVAGCSPVPEPAAPPASREAPPEGAAVGEAEAYPDAAARLEPAAREWVERTLAGLSLRQRAAQLVMPWISGAAPGADPAELERMLRWAERDEVGGLIVSRGRPEAIAAKLNAAQARARLPLLIASDLETGPGMRLSPGGTALPPAMAFGAAGGEDLAREAGRVTAREARAVGIHLTLGPVLDVNSNPDNPIINVRSFGEDPERVARLARAWIEGAREEGLLAAGKHFPGHGDTEVDSHVGLATIVGDSARLDAVELVPFRRAVAAGVDGILVGHIAVVGVEGPGAGPASLSAGMVQGLLRDRMGYDGLVVTDALNMGAVTRSYSVQEASIRAVLAGVDVLLQPPGASGVVDALVQGVESGRIPRARIDEAARRVLIAKASAGLHRRDRVEVDSVRARVGTSAHQALARRVSEASITLVRDRRSLVPLSPATRRVLLVAYTGPGAGGDGRALADELQAAGIRVDRAPVDARTSRAVFASLRERAASADLVVVSAAVAPHQYRALGLQGGFAGFVRDLAAAGTPLVALSLGSPYLLESFTRVPAYLLAWSGAEASQRAAARALLGQLPITGRLPVSLPPEHAVGEGLMRPPRAD